MKKTVVSTFAAALIAASVSTAFAATNPFEDVPADHWAYDAVAQLAAEGVIEGYGDGTYRGDQAITRFEMAQMVARAMAKGGGNKAILDKLAAEFADELNQLGIRVANLEKKVDNVTWKGTVRYRYITSRITEDNRVTRTTDQYMTLRLEPSMKINEHWTGHARIDYNSDMDSAANTTGNTVIGTNVAPGICVERVWVQGDYKNFQILLGKLPYLTNIDNGMIYDDNVAGGQLTFGNKVKATLTVGRSNSFAAAGADPNFPPRAGGGQAYSSRKNGQLSGHRNLQRPRRQMDLGRSLPPLGKQGAYPMGSRSVGHQYLGGRPRLQVQQESFRQRRVCLDEQSSWRNGTPKCDGAGRSGT